MNRPTIHAQFAIDQFLAYQQKLDEHKFYNDADRQHLQQEADYWRNQYEEVDDSSLIENLGLTTQPNP